MKFLENLRRRHRLRKICRKLNIEPYPWQRDFALGIKEWLDFPPGRGVGKTTAVMLRLLMTAEPVDMRFLARILCADPDYNPNRKQIVDWYQNEYYILCKRCDMDPQLLPVLRSIPCPLWDGGRWL